MASVCVPYGIHTHTYVNICTYIYTNKTFVHISKLKLAYDGLGSGKVVQ